MMDFTESFVNFVLENIFLGTYHFRCDAGFKVA